MSKLIDCRACGAEISNAATSCPHCGEPSTKSKQQNQTSVLGCLVVFVIFGAVVYWLASGDGAPSEPEFTAEEIAAGFHCLSKWDGSHTDLKNDVRDMMRNPSSFEHDATRVTPANNDGNHTLTMNYRSENGFGGMTFGTARGLYDAETCEHILVSVE